MIRKLLCFLGWHDFQHIVKLNKDEGFYMIHPARGQNTVQVEDVERRETFTRNLGVSCKHCGKVRNDRGA